MKVVISALAAIMLTGCASAPQLQAVSPALAEPAPTSGRAALDAKIARYAKLYDIPPSLLHRVVKRESNYNPAARRGPYWGLMQIRYDTAQGVGYSGPAANLLDADVNLTFAGAYLANAYRVGGRNEARAIRLYSGGYYYEAKRKGMLSQLVMGAR